MKILSINPGSTSTKIAIYEELNPIFEKTIRHSVEDLEIYPSITDQYEFRKSVILDELKSCCLNFSELDAIVGRGGLLKPIPGGVYKVNELMLEDLRRGVLGEHASNLGGILAYEIAKKIGKPDEAYIVDPVVVDEMDDLARFSGRPELPRLSIFHALNQKAVARRFAREIGTNYEKLNLIVVHLGGGITVGAHKKGKVIDVNNGLDGEGPFSPERTGTLPAGALTKLCFSGKFQLAQVRKMITGAGGFVAYLGTNNAREVEEMAIAGDRHAESVYKAMAYQVAKEIGAMAVVLEGNIDAIIITGGIAYSKILIDWISEKISFLAQIKVYPGEDEMQALTEGVYYAKTGELEVKDYI